MIGYVGDKLGREKALTGLQFFAAVQTTVMGFFPTYSKVGWCSTLLLVVCRLLQRISVRSELPASLVYTVAQSPKGQWVIMVAFPWWLPNVEVVLAICAAMGYYGSFSMVAAKCGSSLGNLSAHSCERF